MRDRRLSFEKLETRTVLSTVIAELTPEASVSREKTDVAFVLELVDEEGRASSAVETGQRLYLNILVEDQRPDGRGVFAAALDLLFDNSLVVLDGTVTFGPSFPNAPHAGTEEPGVLDELSAFGGFTPPGPGRILFAQVPFTVVAPGSLWFATNAADNLPAHEVLVHGWNDAVPSDRVEYGSIGVHVSGSPVAETVVPAAVALPKLPPLSQSVLAEMAAAYGDDFVPLPVVADRDPGEGEAGSTFTHAIAATFGWTTATNVEVAAAQTRGVSAVEPAYGSKTDDAYVSTSVLQSRDLLFSQLDDAHRTKAWEPAFARRDRFVRELEALLEGELDRMCVEESPLVSSGL